MAPGGNSSSSDLSEQPGGNGAPGRRRTPGPDGAAPAQTPPWTRIRARPGRHSPRPAPYAARPRESRPRRENGRHRAEPPGSSHGLASGLGRAALRFRFRSRAGLPGRGVWGFRVEAAGRGGAGPRTAAWRRCPVSLVSGRVGLGLGPY